MKKNLKSFCAFILAIVLCMAVSLSSFAASGSQTKTTSGGVTDISVQFTTNAYIAGNDYVSATQAIVTNNFYQTNMNWDKLIVYKKSGSTNIYNSLAYIANKNSYTFYKNAGSAGTSGVAISTQSVSSYSFGFASADILTTW